MSQGISSLVRLSNVFDTTDNHTNDFCDKPGILKDTNAVVTDVFHLSDIHIHTGLHRINEYVEVFQTTIDKIKSKMKDPSSSLIVVTGDIHHRKLHFDEVTNHLFFALFEDLLALCDVVVIGGNHDFITTRTNQRESLGPLLVRCKGKYNVHFLRDSGEYIYQNIVFGVSSLYDGKFIPANQLKTTNKVKIALFHGLLNGCKTDHITLDYDCKISDFNGYDYVMLGDWHDQMYVEPHAAYAGSLIQQDFGEPLHRHGFLHWKIVEGTSKFVRVKNNYGYITCVFDKNKICLLYTSDAADEN